MYKILGSDGNEYGPVSAEQVHEWITQGRIDANTQIKKDGESSWKKASDFPEFSGVFGVPLLRAEDVPVYHLDVASCLKRAWKLVTGNMFLTIVGTLLVFIALLVLQIPSFIGGVLGGAGGKDGSGVLLGASALFNAVTGILSMVFQGVLYGGLYLFLLKIIRGETAEITDVFCGFQNSFVQLILASVASSLLILLGFILCIVPGIYLAVSYMFVFPLVIDKRMNFWDAMELSRKTVSQHWFILFLLAIVLFGVVLVGFLACCVGILIAVPVSYVALMYAYEDIFGRH